MHHYPFYKKYLLMILPLEKVNKMYLKSPLVLIDFIITAVLILCVYKASFAHANKATMCVRVYRDVVAKIF